MVRFAELLGDSPSQTAYFHKAKLTWSDLDRELALCEELVCVSSALSLSIDHHPKFGRGSFSPFPPSACMLDAGF